MKRNQAFFGVICTLGFLSLWLTYSVTRWAFSKHSLFICRSKGADGFFLNSFTATAERILGGNSSEQKGKSHSIKILPKPSEGTEGDGFYHKQCKCWKHTGRKLFRANSPAEGSTCSPEATYFGPHQKVISFVLVDRNTTAKTRYNIGHWPNLFGMRTFYPGWVMRIYSDFKLKPDVDYCYFICTNDDVFWCDTNDRKEMEYNQKEVDDAMTWRFLVLIDPLVDYFISRDIDSRLGLREVGAVVEWMESPYVFHNMRNHKQYHTKFILGGMWGAKTHLIPMEERRSFLGRIMEDAKNESKSNLTDQEDILSKHLYTEEYFNKILTHDDYKCDVFSKVECWPFPTVFDGVHHVGSRAL